MGFHQQLNGDFLWNCSPETNGDLDGMQCQPWINKPRLRLFKKGRVPFI